MIYREPDSTEPVRMSWWDRVTAALADGWWIVVIGVLLVGSFAGFVASSIIGASREYAHACETICERRGMEVLTYHTWEFSSCVCIDAAGAMTVFEGSTFARRDGT